MPPSDWQRCVLFLMDLSEETPAIIYITFSLLQRQICSPRFHGRKRHIEFPNFHNPSTFLKRLCTQERRNERCNAAHKNDFFFFSTTLVSVYLNYGRQHGRLNGSLLGRGVTATHVSLPVLLQQVLPCWGMSSWDEKVRPPRRLPLKTPAISTPRGVVDAGGHPALLSAF